MVLSARCINYTCLLEIAKASEGPYRTFTGQREIDPKRLYLASLASGASVVWLFAAVLPFPAMTK